MPRKTKKHKLLAQLRRQQAPIASYTYKFTNPQTININNTLEVAKDSISKDFVVKDLRKTLILTMLAIVFELVLYWWWRI